jgi:hypothetical protein
MKNKTNKSIRVMLPVVLLLLLSCATIPKQPPPPPQELRADLGRIGIVSASFQPEVRFQKPMTKEDASAVGVARGALITMGIGYGTGNLLGLAAGVVLSPVGAAVGGIAGQIMGVPSQKIKETEDTLNGCLATLNFQETMRERFLKTVAREQTQYPFLLLEVQGPNALGEEVIYGSLSDKGIDTILEIGLRKCELWEKGGKRLERSINAPLHFLMAVSIRLIRTTDGHVLFDRNFVYDNQNVPLKFSEWGVNNAQPFREELDRAFQFLAFEIVGAVYMIQTPADPQPTEDLQN